MTTVDHLSFSVMQTGILKVQDAPDEPGRTLNSFCKKRPGLRDMFNLNV